MKSTLWQTKNRGNLAFNYIEPFYNRRRRHSTLGYISPQQFLNNWINSQQVRESAA
jgi:putative transposase